MEEQPGWSEVCLLEDEFNLNPTVIFFTHGMDSSMSRVPIATVI